MKQDLELSEQLENEGFTPFDIDELTRESILNDEVFNYVLGIENNINRENILIKLQLKATELKVTRQFNSKLKLFKEVYIKQLKSIDNNETDFEDCPYGVFKCGKWIANNMEIYKKEYTKDLQPIKIKASPIPIIPVERLINIDTNTEKIKIAFQKDGKWQEIIVEKNTIASKSKILQLANRGIEVNEDNAKNLITYFADILELNNIPIKKGVAHLGWIDDKFVPYTEEYCLDVDHEFKQKLNCIRQKGSYEEWKKYIAGLRKDNITLRFMIACSFASVLVKTFKLNTFMVHLWGKSGNGKTVAEMICASIWGRPDENLISNLSNTAIANERLCNFYRNMPIFLDELQIAKARYKSFDELIYILTEGKGKERGTVDNGIREQTLWQNIILLTGEEPITSDVSKEGVKNRVIEINENNPIIENGNETVRFIQENYGFAGKQFIDLIQNKEEVEQIQQNFVKELNESIEYKKQSNAFSIILTADNIVSKYIFNDEALTVEDIKKYIRKDTDETDRIMEIILNIAESNINNFYDNTNTYEPSGQIWGELDRANDGYNGTIFYYKFIPNVLYEELSKRGINWNSIKQKLADKDYIKRQKNGEFTIPMRTKGRKAKIYCSKKYT